MNIAFTTTVYIPDEKLDADGGVVGSEAWLQHRPKDAGPHGVEPWTEGREPAEHYAARMLCSYTTSSDRRVHATTTIGAYMRPPRSPRGR